MGRRTWNIRIGLAVLALLACLITAFGISFARYRADYSQGLGFQTRLPGQICLGTVATADEPQGWSFQPDTQSTWQPRGDGLQLDLAVANGTSRQNYTPETQHFTLRLVGSLGVWDGTDVAELTLRVYEPAPLEHEYRDYQATADRIRKGTPLYRTYGDGWVFSFPEGEGERTWTLDGSAFSTVKMTLILEGNELTQPSLLQPIVTLQ